MMLTADARKTILDEAARHHSGEAKRLFHGRGGKFPGLEWLTIDDLGGTGLVTVYEPYDRASILELCLELASTTAWQNGLLQQRGDQVHWEVLFGSHKDALVIAEDGLKYELDLRHGRNIGFFFDMRTGRQFVHSVAAGRRVLNLFAYTCAFSVVALDGKAKEVVNVDMSSSALQRGRRNHHLNEQDLHTVRFLPHNILKSFGKLCKMGPFDLVIIDPPTHQAGSFVAERDYAKVVRRLPDLLAPHGLVLACLNAPNMGGVFLQSLFSEYGYSLLKDIELTPEWQDASPDKGLKCRVFARATEVDSGR